jgi:hypothetical protein
MFRPTRRKGLSIGGIVQGVREVKLPQAQH